MDYGGEEEKSEEGKDLRLLWRLAESG